MKYLSTNNRILFLVFVPIVLLSSCGSMAKPYPKERELQQVLFLDQERAVIEEFFAQRKIQFVYSAKERTINFGIRDIGSGSGGTIEVGLGGTIHFDSIDHVKSYEIRRHLTGP